MTDDELESALLNKMLEISRRMHLDRSDVLKFRCTHCGANEGEPCAKRHNGRYSIGWFAHSPRVDKMNAARRRAAKK